MMNNLLPDITLQGEDIPKVAALRQKGKQAFLEQGLPSPKTEAWKYTRLRELNSGDFIIDTASTHNHECHNSNCSCTTPVLPFAAYEIKFKNGKLTTNHFHLPDGVEVTPLLQALKDSETTSLINKSFDLNLYPFAALNTAYLEQGVLIRISRDLRLDKPFALINCCDGTAKSLNNIRNIIILESGADAELIEYYHYCGSPKSEYFNNIVNEIFLGRGAHLITCKVQTESYKAVHIALNAVRLKSQAQFKSFSLQKGGNLVRHETVAVLREEYAEAAINAAYIMNGWATIDTTTDVKHMAPLTFSNQLVKGVVGGQAKGVFQGKIHIAPNAVKTEGYQLHRALLMSDEAEIDVKPELEIFADDVKCSHGAACGDLDQEQMFYLRSRGISEEDAKQLLIRAFIDEVIDLNEKQPVKDWLKSF